MKRRTFLRLSSAALASLGMSACGAKPAPSSITTAAPSDIPSDSYTDIVDGGDDSLGMALEDAQEFSSFYNRPYFIHRTNELFYPIALTLEGDSYHAAFLDYETLVAYSECLTLHLSAGDELVYISTSHSIPESVSFSPVIRSGNTIPALITNTNQATLNCLKYYNYDANVSYGTATSSDFYAGTNSTRDHYYYWNTFSKYDPLNAPNKARLFSEEDHISLNGRSLGDTVSALLGYDNLLQISPEPSSNSKRNEYILNECSFMPEEELDLSLLYDWGQEAAKTVECYQGTVYYTFTLPADCAYFIYDLQSFTSCGFSLTPNGYAVVNLGALSSQPYSYILDCSEDLNSPNNAYLFIQP